GKLEYISYIDAKTKGPIYFTDAAGNKTLGAEDIDNYGDNLLDLKGKIIFRDPTFGGVFPDLTNDNIWEYVQSLEKVKDQVTTVCPSKTITNAPDTTVYPPYDTTYIPVDPPVPSCKEQLPDNPSDLDYLVYYLDWS